MRIKSAKFCFRKSNGLAQIPLMIVLLLMAVAIPVATSLVKRSQDIRNRAAYEPETSGGQTKTETKENADGSKVITTARADGTKEVIVLDSNGMVVLDTNIDESGNQTAKDHNGQNVEIRNTDTGFASSNPDVKAAQEILSKAGYGSTLAGGLNTNGVDGYYGLNTQEVIRDLAAGVEPGPPETTGGTTSSAGDNTASSIGGDNTATFDQTGNLITSGGGSTNLTPSPTPIPFCNRKCVTAAKGDANCDQKINIYDIAIWRSEFKDQSGDTVKKKGWNADFNCDGFVNLDDQLIWLKNY